MRTNGLGSSSKRSKRVWRKCRATRLPKRPRVFFEEWDDPLISGIGWVSELVEIAGGIDIFADRGKQGAAKDGVVTFEEVVAREPDLIIGSWCGTKFRPECVATRAGFDRTPAVQRQDLYEIKLSLILQPGPAALTEGLAELQRIIDWRASRWRSTVARD
jgi:iron complex transport system substrate-binding protein